MMDLPTVSLIILAISFFGVFFYSIEKLSEE